jgi:lipopolysaccharide/colanic/teichoic acid biosynthesis glycosyltransferase
MFNKLYRHIGKRVVDLVLSLILLLLTSPVLLVCCILVRLTMGSPMFFIQKRPGRNGNIFSLIKLRTMQNFKDEEGFPLPDKDRLTRLGRFLRSTSIDELPELWNVVIGEMSLVGPRPLLPQYLTRYSEKQSRRHEVLPGLTGLAQINGRNNLDWDKKFEIDVFYVDNLSFFLDIKILAITFLRIIQRKNISKLGSATSPEFKPEL